MEYGFSCMGYEIAGGIGLKMAQPERDVVVMVGDGSYMMMNSELATSVMLGIKLTVVLLDNRGYGCINRLQHACGGERFNNLYDYNTHQEVIAADRLRGACALARCDRAQGFVAGRSRNSADWLRSGMRAPQSSSSTPIR